MSIGEPFVCFDKTATPTVTTDGQGNTITTYPALPGVYAITDLATFARSSDVLGPYRVSIVPAQRIMGGDDPENPTLTVTLAFPDQATYDAMTGDVNALPPVLPPTPAPPSNLPARTLARIDFIERFPAAAQATLATSVDPVIVAARFKLLAVSAVELDATSTQQLVGYLVEQGVITASEAAGVLA
jgi:hypothetical protein